jgi:AraC-like DNA-binding protein
MVCIRCQIAVKYELEKLGLHHTKIELGEVEIMEDLSAEQRYNLSISLKNIGLELINDKKNILVEKIRTIIIELVHYTDHRIKIYLSDYLSEKLHQNYALLSNLFTELKGTTIEKYYLAQRLERAKELLMDDELNLTDIAYKLNYSSVAHLSNQFKKMTGVTPSQFKNLKYQKYHALEEV